MTTNSKYRTLFLALILSMFWTAFAQANTRVLIIDGFSNHSVGKTTQKLLDIIASDPTFKVTVSTMPTFNTAEWKRWEPNFGDYDVIIQTTNNIKDKSVEWPDRVKSELESYIRGGGGMYVYHSANNAFADWPEYNRMIGMGWRSLDFGKALKIENGEVVEIPAGMGKKTHHGPRLDVVFNRFGNHPIHANLPQSWKSADVEVYAYPRGPVENLTVLSFAREPVNNIDFPTEWVVSYGAGRTYTSTYGHYMENQDDPPGVRDVAFQTLLLRALQWLADKPVTQSVPGNFPTDKTISLQDTPPLAVAPVSSSRTNVVYAALKNKTIEIYSQNAGSGKLAKLGVQEISDTPFYLKIHPNRKYLYVGFRGETHGIEAFSIDSDTGLLTSINKVDLDVGPVHMGIDKTGRFLFSASYGIDKVSLSRLSDGGHIVDVNYFPTGKNPHAFEIDSSNRFAYVPCLGSDSIQQYAFDASKGTLIPADPFVTETVNGAGPRLLVFHGSKNIMYQGNEKDSTITAYRQDPKTGDLSSFQTVSTLPDGYAEKSNVSELHQTPDGRFLYIANRGHNSITGYKIDENSGNLATFGFFKVPGRTIRSFSIESSGRFLYAADQRSGELVTFSINPISGELSKMDVMKTGTGIGMVIAETIS